MIDAKVNIYRVNVDADWIPYEATFDCSRSVEWVSGYPQVYRDDILESDSEWAVPYDHKMHELIGKPLEIYVDAVDELGAFVRARQLLAEYKS